MKTNSPLRNSFGKGKKIHHVKIINNRYEPNCPIIEEKKK